MVNFLPKRKLLCALQIALTCIFTTNVGHAQDFPNKPLKFIVGFPAGGSADIISRLLAQKLSERLNQTVIVEQRIGATGLIANDFVVKSPPDGYNMVLLSGGHPVSAAIMQKLPYDPVKDFGMVTTVIGYPMVILVAKDSPIKSLSDLLYRARAMPGKISFSSAGIGSLHHLTGEWISSEAEIPAALSKAQHYS